MGWTPIENAKAKKSTQVSFRLITGRGGTNPKFSISLSSAVAAALGFENYETVSVLMGSEDDAGKMLVQPDPDGGFKLVRLAHAITVRVPCPPGLPIGEFTAMLDWQQGPEQKDGCGFVIALPRWAIPGQGGEAVKRREDKPLALEIAGSRLICGATEVALVPQSVPAVALLVARFGTPVFEKDMEAELQQAGHDKSFLFSWMTKLGERITAAKMSVQLVSPRRACWELRRAVT